jgi:NADH:ubiquinone reductase (H+-translocating)
MSKPCRIVIVGGGAGGLELATKLGDTLGRRDKAEITLIDANRTHIWKPLLHEVAAGTVDVGEHQLEYLAQARWHHFRFRLGYMDGLDRVKQEVQVASSCNARGEQIIPRRSFGYDILVIAVGSLSNDFGISGVTEHCLFLDTSEQAQQFQQQLLETLLQLHTTTAAAPAAPLHMAIVGGGATGVELTAQLHEVTRQLSSYGLDSIDPEQDIHLDLIEAGPRILSALPERLSQAATEELERLGVHIHTGERVVEVTEAGIKTASGHFIKAGITVWAAGIKAPDFLADLHGLESNSINQLRVHESLQTTQDQKIFALGDCADCPMHDGHGSVPPRAQAAHQQASHVARQIRRSLKNKPARAYRYRDYGSLVTLGRYTTVGNLMGGVGSMMVSGWIARMVYLSLHQMHLAALYGLPRSLLLALANMLRRSLDPQVKLH